MLASWQRYQLRYQLTRVSIRKRDLNVKYIREVRQFWKQCRERGERRGRRERKLRSGTSESQSPMVSYLRVGRVSREPCGGIYRDVAAVALSERTDGAPGAQTFSQQFSKLEPSYPRYLILPKCRETSCVGRKILRALRQRNFHNDIRGGERSGPGISRRSISRGRSRGRNKLRDYFETSRWLHNICYEICHSGAN